MLKKTKNNINNWTDEEFSKIEFKDKRLKARFLKIAKELSKKSEAPINQSCGGWAETKAAYRFFANNRVSSNNIIFEHCKKTALRVKNLNIVLIIQDTCYLSYSHHPKTKGLCQIRHNIKGLVMHTSLAISAQGLPVGILYQKIWSRKPRLKKIRNYRFVPIKDKEPFKWIEALRASVRMLNTIKTRPKVISIADREADVFEFMLEHKALNVPFIIRAKSNRPVNKRKKRSKSNDYLWGYMKKINPCCTIDVEVSENNRQPRRMAKVNISFSNVKLQPPTNKTNNKDGDLNSFKVNVVFATEVNASSEKQKVEWMLLTDLPVNRKKDALQIINFYKMRWSIENYHKVLKSDCTIEKCRLNTADRLIRYISLMSVIAWRLYYITHIARSSKPYAYCTKILADYEWKALYLKMNPGKHIACKPPTISQVIKWIAKLGGFLGRKNDHQPGIIVMCRGWTRLIEIADDYLLFSKKCG